MKPQVIITAGMLFTALGGFAQAKKDNTLKLSDIQLSNAPAFNILDISPSSIQRPASTKAFTTNVLSNLTNGIPQNYAMEVTPFWFMKHPHLNTSGYMGINTPDTFTSGKVKYNQNIFNSLKFASVSAALVNKDSSTNAGRLANHNLGFGVQTTVLAVYRQTDLKNIYEKALRWKQAINTPGAGPSTGADLNTFEANTQPLIDSLKEALKAKPLFSIDFAGATNIAFDSNTIKSNRLNRTGLWLNFNLSLPLVANSNDNYFNLSGVTRYIFAKDSLNDNKQYIKTNYFDFGAKAEFSFRNLSLAYEYIRRTSSAATVTASFRSVGLIQYKLSDGLFLTGAFGQNFGVNNNLFTALGLTWGISNGQEKLEGQ